MSSPGLTDPRDPRYAFNACSLRAGTTSIRARWKRPIFRRRFAKVHASVRTQSPKQYSVSNIVSYIYIYTYHKSKCIIISSHVLSCFVIYCLILSYTISCISSMDWFNIKMIGSHGCLPILGGFPVDFLLQNYGTAFSRLEKRNPWWTIKRLSISVLHQMHLEPSMAMKQTSAKLMELRYLGDS